MITRGLLLLLVGSTLMVYAAPTTWTHPGVLLDMQRLNDIKSAVAKKIEPYYSEYIKALADNIGNKSYTPLGPPAGGGLNCGFYWNPDVDLGCTHQDQDSAAAYLQAILWYITDDSTYADNVIRLLNAYSYNLTSISGGNAPLEAAYASLKWTRAAEIISYTSKSWTAEDKSKFSSMLYRIFVPLIWAGNTGNGNWELSMIEGMFGISVFTENSTLFDHAVQFWQERVPSYFYDYSEDGNKPVPAPRGDPSWYGNTIFNETSTGISQETCRFTVRGNQAVEKGYASTFNAAETAYLQGTNLYSSSFLNRLFLTSEFHAKYMNEKNSIPQWLCSSSDPIVLYPIFEVAYYVLNARFGIELNETYQTIVDVIRPMKSQDGMYVSIYESLTHAVV